MHSSGGLERSRARYVQLPHPDNEVLCRVTRAESRAGDRTMITRQYVFERAINVSRDAGDRGSGPWRL
jgi:hypothetical protein